MRAREITTNYVPRMLDVKQLAYYMGIGLTNTRLIGEKTGALKRIGRRILFDRVIIDKYLDELTEEDLLDE